MTKVSVSPLVEAIAPAAPISAAAMAIAGVSFMFDLMGIL